MYVGVGLSPSGRRGCAAGNAATPASKGLDVDLTADIGINAVAVDNVLNAAEHGQDLTITGTSHGIEPGQQITLSVDGQTYTAQVQPDGSWSTTLPAGAVQQLAEGQTYSVSASATDAAGNPASARQDVLVDTSLAARADTDQVIEDTRPTASGNLLSNDDTGATLTSAGTQKGAYGTLTIDADGTYHYLLDARAQALTALAHRWLAGATRHRSRDEYAETIGQQWFAPGTESDRYRDLGPAARRAADTVAWGLMDAAYPLPDDIADRTCEELGADFLLLTDAPTAGRACAAAPG